MQACSLFAWLLAFFFFRIAYQLLGTYARFCLSKSKMEKNIRDKDSGLCTVKMLSTTNVIQVALICSRAEQKLLLQSLLHLGRLCWLSSLFCFHTPQKSVGVGLRTLKGDVQRCCFSSAYILISCLSHCPALM